MRNEEKTGGTLREKLESDGLGSLLEKVWHSRSSECLLYRVGQKGWWGYHTQLNKEVSYYMQMNKEAGFMVCMTRTLLTQGFLCSLHSWNQSTLRCLRSDEPWKKYGGQVGRLASDKNKLLFSVSLSYQRSGCWEEEEIAGQELWVVVLVAAEKHGRQSWLPGLAETVLLGFCRCRATFPACLLWLVTAGWRLVCYREKAGTQRALEWRNGIWVRRGK